MTAPVARPRLSHVGPVTKTTTAHLHHLSSSVSPVIPLPDRMTVIAIRKLGGPDVLTPELRSLPRPAAGEIPFKVAAAGVNPPDVMQVHGPLPTAAKRRRHSRL